MQLKIRRSQRQGGVISKSVIFCLDARADLTAGEQQNFVSALSDIQAGVEECRNGCDYFLLCGGGCPSNKLAETGSTRSSETRYCRLTRKALTDVTLEEIEREYHLIEEF